jgi:hypothetical protein
MYPKIYIELFRSFDRTPEVFVAMPFSKEFEPRWKSIYKPAILSCNLKAYRVKERLVGDSIPIDILNGINRAKFLLFDISNEKTGRPNSNVMYELGIGHATRFPEEVIVVRDIESENVPFDIKHIRWNTLSLQKVKQSANKIKTLIKKAEEELDLTKDLMIKKALSSLDQDMMAFLDTIRNFTKKGFDLCPFDPDRKGLYGLPHKDCSEEYLRELARGLINLGIKSAEPLPLEKRFYGVTPEYYLTELWKAILSKIPEISK